VDHADVDFLLGDHDAAAARDPPRDGHRVGWPGGAERGLAG
jgi:hypothetical protein